LSCPWFVYEIDSRAARLRGIAQTIRRNSSLFPASKHAGDLLLDLSRCHITDNDECRVVREEMRLVEIDEICCCNRVDRGFVSNERLPVRM
jgi:hypothetical protein